MVTEGNLDYALARIHAKHGQLPDETAWRGIESSRDLAHYLGAVRSSALADWVATIEPSQDAHGIERSLRAQWRRYVRDVASWHPREWQPWLVWTSWLPALSLLPQLARAEPAPVWLLADPVLGPVAPGSPAERATALGRTVLAPLAAVALNLVSPLAAWNGHWQRLLPQTDLRTLQLLQVLLRTLQRHDREMRSAMDSADSQRADLSQGLMRLFRNSAQTVIATVCHLGLLALHLERLRGGLVRRRLFA